MFLWKQLLSLENVPMGKAVFTSNKSPRSCTDKNYPLETVNQCVSPTQPSAAPHLANPASPASLLDRSQSPLVEIWSGLPLIGHIKSWSSSPRQGWCFQITWWNTPPCCAKYPASTGSVTCAFPPALLLHCAYLESSFTSWNFNHISFLNTGLFQVTAEQKSLESTEDEFSSSASIYMWW